MVLCIECGRHAALIKLEPKYNGFRGKCLQCDGEWPES